MCTCVCLWPYNELLTFFCCVVWSVRFPLLEFIEYCVNKLFLKKCSENCYILNFATELCLLEAVILFVMRVYAGTKNKPKPKQHNILTVVTAGSCNPSGEVPSVEHLWEVRAKTSLGTLKLL